MKIVLRNLISLIRAYARFYFQIYNDTETAFKEKKIVDIVINGLLLLALVLLPFSIVVLAYIYRIAILAVVVIVWAFIVEAKERRGQQADNPAFYNQQIADRVTVIITEILTTLYDELGIIKPYDTYFVWATPTYVNDRWCYHAKAKQSDKAQTDPDSLLEIMTIINRRAAEIGAPIVVTDVHPRGKMFVFDVEITNNIASYMMPSEDTTHDRYF